jgi:citrate lyase subunit beta/citryl-CoA lyase
VRVNSIESGELSADLAVVMAGRPDGIMLPKGEPEHLRALDQQLRMLEPVHGIEPGSVKVIVIATETARALFAIGGYAGISARLIALTWGGEDLAAVLGAVNRNQQGEYEDTFRLARSLCALGASAAGVDAIDAACMDFNDLAAFERECIQARRAGFTGKLAIHPRQVPPINATFTPSTAEVDWAQRVVAAFQSQPELGVIALDGRVIDRPHLHLAQRLLARL